MSKQPPPREAAWPERTIFTVGHSTLPIERFLALLAAYGIEQLADIRTVPRSRRNPQFNAAALRASLEAAGISYVPLGELGGLRKPRPDSPNAGWRNESFRGYADYMQTEQFGNGLGRLVAKRRPSRCEDACGDPRRFGVTAPSHHCDCEAILLKQDAVVAVTQSPTEALQRTPLQPLT